MTIRDTLDKYKSQLPEYATQELKQVDRHYEDLLDVLDKEPEQPLYELAMGGVLTGSTAMMLAAYLSAYVVLLLEKVEKLEKQLKQDTPEF
jgi:hypothetical protein